MAIPGGFELLIVAGVVVLLFGVNKLPKLGGAIGESIKNFKKGIQDTDPNKALSADNKSQDSSDKSSSEKG